ncbi:MAG: efflux RND transporter periplasmic adaptor subunit [Deltaproteobacteria bacterium]
MTMTRKTLVAGAIVALAAGAAVAYFRSASVISVDVFEARKGPIEEIVTAVSAGTVKSRWESVLSAETLGRVVAVRAREGDAVRKGAVLAVLSDAELARRIDAAGADVAQAANLLEQAKARRTEAAQRFAADSARAAANLAKAKADRTRAEELFRGGYLAKAEMDQAETALANAEADARVAGLGEVNVTAIDREIDSLRSRIEGARASAAALSERRRKLTVTAPFDGIVTRKTVEVGEIKQPGSPLFVLEDPRTITVEAPIDESESAKVRVGQKVRLYPDSYLGETFAGEVSEVKPTIEASKEVSRANTIKVAPVSPPKPLRLGMSVDVEVLTGRKEDALQVPSSAVMEREAKKFVYLVVGGKAVRRDVTTGISNWDRTEIASGLSPGDAVVTSLEIRNLSPGSRVAIRTRQ